MSANPIHVPAPAPLAPVPAARQLAWQRREFIAFVHFGVNTFTDREWGLGNEDPAIFNPSELDCHQWVAAIKAAGMKQVIITAKHHDGFCLWPSAYTEHSVKNSPWRGGRGDVVRELSEAAAAGGLDFGVYLSPWDRHEPSYGSGQAYNEHYLKQLRELLTNYGPISEIWFDGACGEGPNGKRQVYDFRRFWGTVRELAPNAVMFSDEGPDVRWVGNESGYSDDPQWSTVNRFEMGIGASNAAQTHGHLGGSDWLPAETDVSIRPGWFYHAAEDDQVHSLDHLLDIWHRSVGLNTVLLLNLPPDRRGLIHENDVARLAELRAALEDEYRVDHAFGAPAVASNVRGGCAAFGAAKAVDGDDGTYWATDDGVTSASLEIALPAAPTVARAKLAEFIELGQRVTGFRLELKAGGSWGTVAEGQTIGYQRLLRFEPRAAQAARLTITGSRACPCVRTLGLY